MADGGPLSQPAITSLRAVPHVYLRGITKIYGQTIANHEVDFDLAPGEIHALLGENGAGKTTLMSIMFGLVPFDEGELALDDEKVRFSSPHDALERGIGMVHQHFMLVPTFTVAENVVLGSQPSTNLKFRRSEIERAVGRSADEYSIGVDPRARIRDLPVDVQQRVEILKLLYRGAKVLILDEPTASLGPAQIAAMFSILEDLREQGHSVVIVTHKLGEVMQIADRVTVLKGGRNSMSARRGEFDEASLARAMTGRQLEGLPPRGVVEGAEAHVLSVSGLNVHAAARLNAVHDATFHVDGGEIVGVAGVEGNGQRELVDAIAGVAGVDSGSITVDGKEVTGLSPRQLIASGVAVIPEDRHGWGLVLDMTLAENLALAAVPAGRFRSNGLLNKRQMRTDARRLLEEFDVRPPDPDMRALSLSGGNQQKVVLAREMGRNPRVLVAANPSRGLDVGATEYVHRKLLEARERGGAVLLVSNDLEELLKLSDRIVVLYRGRIVYETAVADISMDRLSMAMAGSVQADGQEPSRPEDGR